MHKMSRSSVVLIVALVAALAACAPATAQPIEPTQAVVQPEAATPLPAQPTTAAAPITFTYSVPFEIPNIDPAVVTDYPGGVALRALYDPLLRARGTPVVMEPWLATGYEVSADGTQYTFHLRDGVKFHDGTPLTADAVAYTFTRWLALKSGFAWMFEGIMDTPPVVVVDDLTVRFDLKAPFAPFPATLGYLYVVNPAVVKAHEVSGDWGSAWLVDHEAGSGPTTISRWEPGTMYEFAAVPDYWAGWPHKEQNPSIFRYMVEREAGSARLALEAGELDWAVNISEEDSVQLKDNPSYEIVTRPMLEVVNIWMNTASKGPIGDVNVRKAIAYAFDYAGYNKAVFEVGPASSYLPQGLPGVVASPELRLTDLTLAKQFLAETKWPDGGFEVNFVFLGGWSPEDTGSLILIDSLSKLNIKVNAISKTWTEMSALCADVKTIPDMIFITTNAPYADPYAYLYSVYGPAAPGWANCHGFVGNPALSELLAKARLESDEAKRMQIYADVQDILVSVRPGILLGMLSGYEAHNVAWTADAYTPLFGYIGYPQDYYKK